MHKLGVGLGLLMACVGLYAAACSDDDTVAPVAGDGGVAETGTDGTVATDAGADSGNQAAVVERGRYLVENIMGCGDCHTPRVAGSADKTRLLSGVDCLIGFPGGDAGEALSQSDPGDAGFGVIPGCLNSRNLTNDATGLKNRTDQQIKDMFMNGVRPNGDHLNPTMPWWEFHNMSDDDANAVVAYLRTVPPVVHDVQVSEDPWKSQTPAIAITPDQIPAVPANAANHDSAVRGRYLATLACLDCHTPDMPDGGSFPQPQDMSRPFAGSRTFPIFLFHIPTPPFPAYTYTQNLTQDSTGLLGYQPQDIVREIKEGKDRDGGGICIPMPAGPGSDFGGMTDSDALDIANYILTLPPIVNQRKQNCVAN